MSPAQISAWAAKCAAEARCRMLNCHRPPADGGIFCDIHWEADWRDAAKIKEATVSRGEVRA